MTGGNKKKIPFTPYIDTSQPRLRLEPTLQYGMLASEVAVKCVQQCWGLNHKFAALFNFTLYATNLTVRI